MSNIFKHTDIRHAGKLTFAVLLYVLSFSSAIAQSRETSSSDMFDFRQSEVAIHNLDITSEKLKESIRNTPTTIDIKGRSYYVATDGDDANDGLSANSPVKSLSRVNSIALQEGDAVLFKRDDLWRGHVKTKSGVTYSAYGSGNKPQIYGSPYDAALEGSWIETEAANVYVYNRDLPDDIGTLVFNEGESCAIKVMKEVTEDGSTIHIETKKPFADYRDLKSDLEFYHDYKDKKRLYLCSTKGNPSKRFNSIELLVKTHIIYAGDNVTVDNLCLKYCGGHGIGSGTTKGLTVTNCEIGWIGGSIHGEALYGRTFPTRYGNAIEIYGGCDYFLVDNCYIYQVYDAAITHQFSSGGNEPIIMKNVTYSNNLVEDCVYSIEYFMGYSDNGAERYMKNIRMKNNLLRRSGFGWGKQRPDKETPAHIKSWAHYNNASDFIIEGNIFDRGTVELLNIEADKKEWLPTLKENTYIQHINVPTGTIGEKRTTYPFDEGTNSILKMTLGENTPKIIYVSPLDKY